METVKTETPLPEVNEELARKEWEKLLMFGATPVQPLKQPYLTKQKLILTLRKELRVGNRSFGKPVFEHYGADVKEIEVMYECIGPMQDDCAVLALASEDGHDKPKYRICCKLSDVRPYPLQDPKPSEPVFVPLPALPKAE